MSDDGERDSKGASSYSTDMSRARHEIIDMIAKRVVKITQAKAEKPLTDLCEKLPSKSAEIRNLPFYGSTLEALKYQRDNYLVGTKYAEEQKLGRQLNPSSSFAPSVRMPYDVTALGNIQTIKLGSWFIPSPTVKNAALPIVVGLPGGALREPILNATVNAIPLAQPSLNQVVKNSMLQVMEDSYWRDVMKSRTNTYITHRDE